ncbi:MAG: aminotransferase class I/II-fold pyridoxal phosphate-dependent enzyme [Eubacteriales bacterium]
MSKIIEQLVALKEGGTYPYHMPGHKRNMSGEVLEESYNIDITEIDGFDNLHNPEDLLLMAKKRVEELFCSDHSFYLVNGSTAGILAAICSVTNKGDTILMSRNCHKAVYHGVELQELQTEYLYPTYLQEWDMVGGIAVSQVKEKLEQCPTIKAVIITSPTYEGIVSDIQAIAEVVHQYGIPLIVDEAHGAHFILHERFPTSAILCGADIIIQSVHKTLPSLTQTALLHVKGERVSIEQVKRYLSIFQTSSPSYVLMASIDRCIEIMENQGRELANQFIERMDKFLQEVSGLKNIKIVTYESLQKETELFGMIIKDLGKLVISVKDTRITGQELYDLLRLEYGLQMEMAAPTHVVAIMTIMDTEEGFWRLRDALFGIDPWIGPKKDNSSKKSQIIPEIKKQDLTKTEDFINLRRSAKNKTGNKSIKNMEIAEALSCQQEKILWKDSRDRVAGDYINLYPPGIPLITPGEVITEELWYQIQSYMDQGLNIQGIDDLDYLIVVK